MGMFEEFTAVQQNAGPMSACKWIARNVLTTYHRPVSEFFVEALSPVTLDRNRMEQRFTENGSIEYYDREREVTVDLPVGKDHVETFSERIGTYTISQPFVGALEDVTLFGSYPVVFDRDKNLVLEPMVQPSVLTLNIGYTGLDFISDPIEMSRGFSPESFDCAVLLYNRWNRGYYHWTVETLTLLQGVRTFEERTGVSPKLIVGPDPNRFQLQTLEMLGYGEDDLINWDCMKAKVERLIVPSMRRELNRGTVSPIAYQWLRDQMRSAVSNTAYVSEDVSKRVYISREDAPRRRIVNEDEVLDVLHEYGFEKYVLSDHNVAEIIDLFIQADIIVGPHGAGLTDIMYTDDVTVVELFRSNDVRPTYYVLSEHLDHRYRYLLCDYEGPDLVVDTDALEELIAREI